MRCPFCGCDDTVVKDSRSGEGQTTVRRRRSCPSCGARFSTVERVHLRDLCVLKRNGEREPFDTHKLERSLQLALHKRPVDRSKIDHVVNSIIRQLEGIGEPGVPSSLIGEKVMDTLSHLDEVAYVRYASIYCDFQVVQDFARFIEEKLDQETVEKQRKAE